MPFLSLSILIPLVVSVAVAFVPARASAVPRTLALGASVAALACIAATWLGFDSGKGCNWWRRCRGYPAWASPGGWAWTACP